MSDIENLSQRSFMPDFKFQYTPSIKEEVQQAIENTKDKPGDEMLSILQEEIKQFQTKLDDKHEMFISQDGADFCILQIQIKNNYLILFGKDIKENSCEMIIHATQAHLILHSVRVVDETKVARRAIGFSVD